MNEDKLICYQCEQYLTQSHDVYNDRAYCENCFNESFDYCDDCETATKKEDLTTIGNENGKLICVSCLLNNYTRCRNCDNYTSDTYTTNYNHPICYPCYEDSHFTCETCNRIYHIDYYCGDGLCNNCESNDLYDYNYVPNFSFYGKPDNNLFFGIELEIENRFEKNLCGIISNLPDYLYAKDDGSLDDGFEIVSHPASFEWIKENLHHWREIFKLTEQGFRSYQTTTCGMHIHMSRKAFGTIHLYKFLKIFYENPDFIIIISRRGSAVRLEEYASLTTDESLIIKARKKFEDEYVKRYTAVNLYNRNTIEVRIFRGTLAEQGFIRNLEFCKAVYDFTEQVSVKNCTQENLIEYITKSKQYPNLHHFIKDKNLDKIIKIDDSDLDEDE